MFLSSQAASFIKPKRREWTESEQHTDCVASLLAVGRSESNYNSSVRTLFNVTPWECVPSISSLSLNSPATNTDHPSCQRALHQRLYTIGVHVRRANARGTPSPCTSGWMGEAGTWHHHEMLCAMRAAQQLHHTQTVHQHQRAMHTAKVAAQDRRN